MPKPINRFRLTKPTSFAATTPRVVSAHAGPQARRLVFRPTFRMFSYTVHHLDRSKAPAAGSERILWSTPVNNRDRSKAAG
jgi:hypothetical protein